MARVKIKVSGTKVSLWIRFSFGEKIDIGEYANIMQVKKMMMSQGNPIRLYSLDEITETGILVRLSDIPERFI